MAHRKVEQEARRQKAQSGATLVHYFSDRADPSKSILPLLVEGADQDDELVFMVEPPLSEVVDHTIWLHMHPDVPTAP